MMSHTQSPVVKETRDESSKCSVVDDFERGKQRSNGQIDPQFYDDVLTEPKPQEKSEILKAEEFSTNIVSWFGEKGFNAMRSFFRATVLNSIQTESSPQNGNICSDSDALTIALVTDYLVRKGKYYTLSVYNNEVLKPVKNSNEIVYALVERIGQGSETGLNLDIINFILKSIDLNPYSPSGYEIIQNYFRTKQDLLTILMRFLKDNASGITHKTEAVRDDDLVAAFSEGFNEEFEKFKTWFADFNEQFASVSVNLKEVLSSRKGIKRENTKEKEADDKEIWEQAKKIDNYLQKQQDYLMKLRDRERQKLLLYAKQLEKLHREMNLKLKAIQKYEETLKNEDKAKRKHVNEQGDYFESEETTKFPTREASTQCYESWFKSDDVDKPGRLRRVMEENLELRATLRQQKLRIDSLTRRVARLSGGEDEPASRPVVPRKQAGWPTGLTRRLNEESGLRLMVTRARAEIENLRDEQDSADKQYDRLLHNRLSKK